MQSTPWVGLLPPDGPGAQLRRTAPTDREEAQAPDARMLSRIDGTDWCGVSCGALPGGVRRQLESSLTAKTGEPTRHVAAVLFVALAEAFAQLGLLDVDDHHMGRNVDRNGI